MVDMALISTLPPSHPSAHSHCQGWQDFMFISLSNSANAKTPHSTPFGNFIINSFSHPYHVEKGERGRLEAIGYNECECLASLPCHYYPWILNDIPRKSHCRGYIFVIVIIKVAHNAWRFDVLIVTFALKLWFKSSMWRIICLWILTILNSRFANAGSSM